MPLINAKCNNGVRTFYSIQHLNTLVKTGITNIRFRLHHQNVASVKLGTNENSCKQDIGVSPQLTQAVGLCTCASVIYVSDTAYYVHHANCGDVSYLDFHRAIKALGYLNTINLRVIYAHTNATDEGYLSSINRIISYGIPSFNIFEIENLEFNQFGINNRGILGY